MKSSALYFRAVSLSTNVLGLFTGFLHQADMNLWQGIKLVGEELELNLNKYIARQYAQSKVKRNLTLAIPLYPF